MKLTKLTPILLAAGLTSLVGCAQDAAPNEGLFQPEGAPRAVHGIYEMQARKGALEDATLQPYHFDGDQLNSLGESKLSLLLPAQPDETVTVYVNLPALADTTAARKESINEFFALHGLQSESVSIETGSNPGLRTPAAGSLSRMAKTETDGSTTEDAEMSFGGSR